MEIDARTTSGWRPGTLPPALANPAVTAILLFGPDQGGVFEIALAAARAGGNHTRHDAKTADFAAIDTALGSGTLFGGGTSILLDGASDAQAARIAPLLDRPYAEATRLVVTAGELPKSSRLRKLFAASKTAVAAPLYMMGARDIESAARDIIRNQGLGLAAGARVELGQRLSGDRALAARACEVAALHAAGRGSETVEAADLAAILDLCDEEDLSAPLEHALLGETIAALRGLHLRLARGESFVAMLRFYSARIFRLHGLLETGLPPRDAVARARPPIFWTEKDKFIRMLGALSIAKLDRMIALIDAAECNIIEKGLRESTVLGSLLLEIAQHKSWKEA